MAKYSTNSSNSNNSDNIDLTDDDVICEVCSSDSTLSKIGISGTTVIVCKDCKGKYESKKSNNKTNNKTNKQDENGDDESWLDYATTTDPDSSWVEESRPNYGNAETPYLINNYSKKFEKALYDEQIDKEKLSDEIDVDINIIKSILDGEAIRNDVNKQQISHIEDYLDIKLQD